MQREWAVVVSGLFDKALDVGIRVIPLLTQICCVGHYLGSSTLHRAEELIVVNNPIAISVRNLFHIVVKQC